MEKPKLSDYNVKTLVILGNQAYDVDYKDEVRKVLVRKLSDINCSMLYLLNNFITSKDILREAYAELIMIMMYDNKISLPDVITDEIIKLVSMDTLTKYGMESSCESFSQKCKDEFWIRALEDGDNIEFENKRKMDVSIKLKKIIIGKKKGD